LSFAQTEKPPRWAASVRWTGLCRALLALVALLCLVLATLILATLVLAVTLLLLIGALRRLLLLVLPTLTLLTLAGVLVTFVHWFPLLKNIQ
jgi:hypothetical protein